LWYRVIGPEYIELAFTFAHQADPQAFLCYNDFWAEGINDKSNAIYAMFESLISKDIPIHCMGFQAHIPAGFIPADQDYLDFESNLKRFTDLGVMVNISEMTVAIDEPVTQAKLQQQAEIYGRILASALKNPRFTSFQMWGFTDRYSGSYSCVYDTNLKPKLAYNAVVNSLKGIEGWELPAGEGVDG
jgi:endo-1,4-beta-xylanase